MLLWIVSLLLGAFVNLLKKDALLTFLCGFAAAVLCLYRYGISALPQIFTGAFAAFLAAVLLETRNYLKRLQRKNVNRLSATNQ